MNKTRVGGLNVKEQHAHEDDDKFNGAFLHAAVILIPYSYYTRIWQQKGWFEIRDFTYFFFAY